MTTSLGLNVRSTPLWLSAAMMLLVGCPGGGDGRTTNTDTGIDSIGPNTGDGSGSDTGGDDPNTTADDVATTNMTGVDSTATSDTGPPPGAELLYVAVAPANSVIELDLDSPSSQDFIATAVYTDGSEIDVTAAATWDLTNAAVGSMSGATLDIPGFPMPFFESTIITADYMDKQGQAQVTIAAYQQSGATPDFFFVLPYNDPAGPQTKELTFSTSVKSMDVFFNMDTTGSMDGEVSNLQNSLSATVVPSIVATIPNTQFGVGAYEDFPVAPYGESNCTYGALGGPDQPFQLFQEITDNIPAVQAAVNQLGIGGNAIGCGNDGPESAVEAMYQIATGDGVNAPAPTNVPANASGIGGVGFRDGTMPVVVNITDAVSHHSGPSGCAGVTYAGATATNAATEAEAMTALNAICARVIQVSTTSATSCSGRSDGIAYNNATGAVVPPEAWDVAGHPPGCAVGQCCTGINGASVAPDAAGMCPLTYLANGNGTGVDSSIVAGIQMVARYSPFDVTREWDGVDTDQDGVPLPAGTTTADFIKAVTPLSHGPVPVPGVANPVLTPTTFEGVVPDTDVTFTVEAYNDFVPQGPEPRLFVATIRVLADDCGALDERDVFILLPPMNLEPPG
ncbi:vWA domain-containing protein [Paraliomyxa miuraensis]|uniref:hypothetical protein n=1 Tax=Paraliomyxa miuraensis TaxID=376150 RepID=UPI0022584D5D|nr:hypothetical protein [Paraliomyxa miuraensis]MCX4242990.1 hypothetical protein [Paraliomyxa miuraensis]